MVDFCKSYGEGHLGPSNVMNLLEDLFSSFYTACASNLLRGGLFGPENLNE